MLSYVDIFNEIMKPIGMKYHIDIEVTKNIEACVPKNQFNYWHFLYPREVSDIFSFSLSPDKTDIFSSVKISHLIEFRIPRKNSLEIQ